MARIPDTESALLAGLAANWTPEDIVIDPWSGLAHKQLVGPGSRAVANLAPTWVGSHARRLNAYRVLAAYMNNVARAFLPSAQSFGSVGAQSEHREYGDPMMLVDAIRTAVIGDDAKVVVDGAGERPIEPDDPGLTAEPGEQLEFLNAETDFLAAQAEFDAATERQEWVDEWCDDEKFPLAMSETEQDAIGLGDGVYYVAWSNEKKRVRLRFYDPGFYFPVLVDDDDYPNRVHLAWQREEDDGKSYVRRITFERRKMPGGATKRYPWAQDEPSEYAVYMTDAEWPYEDLGEKTVDQFDLSKAEIKVNGDGVKLVDFDLGIDFIPVVHVPNTASRKHHYGVSAITRVAQIFDDIANVDSDLYQAASVTGAPVLAVGGRAPASGEIITYGPGQVFFTGEGKMDALDLSGGLTALISFSDKLLERLSVNGRVPEEVLGRVRASEVASGILLALSFGPFRALVRDMRQVRDDKYALLFRFVQRLAMVGGQGGQGKGTLPPGPDMRIEVKFGAFMPQDVAGVVNMVIALLAAHGISRASALRILRDAGLDLDEELAEELKSIEHEDFDGAGKLADALESPDAAGTYLGREEEVGAGAAALGGGAPGAAGMIEAALPPVPGEPGPGPRLPGAIPSPQVEPGVPPA